VPWPAHRLLSCGLLALTLVSAACAGPDAGRDGPREAGNPARAGSVTEASPAMIGPPAARAGLPPSGSPSDASSSALNEASLAELERIRAAILETGKCSDEDLLVLRDLFARYPRSADLRAVLANALVRRRDWTGLAAVYEAWAGRTPDDDVQLAKAYVKVGRFDEAAAILVPLAEASPGDVDLAYNAAFALRHAGRGEDAAAILDGSWREIVAAGDPNALTLRALVHIAAGELDPALLILQELTVAQPDYFPAWNALGRARAAAGDLEGAAVAYERLEELHAASEAETARRLRLSARSKALKEAWAVRDLEAAESLVDAMLPEASELGDAQLARTLHEFHAAIYEAKGRPEQAREALEEAARIDLAVEP